MRVCGALLLLGCAVQLFAAEICVCNDSGNLVSGVCEDSGPGSVSAVSALGTDCSDCGPSSRLALQPGADCGHVAWVGASSCESGVVDAVTGLCFCDSPASSAADNCTVVEDSCGAPCIAGTEACCTANAALVRVLGYDRRQITANDPVHGTYMPFTEESEALTMVGTDYPQLEALHDGSIIYAHGDALELFSPDGTHLGNTPIGFEGLIMSCLRALNGDLLLICDANSSSILLTQAMLNGDILDVTVVHQIMVQDAGVDVDVELLDLAFQYDSDNQTYSLYLLASDQSTGSRTIFGGVLLESDIDLWIEAPSNDTSSIGKLFEVDWTDESYGMEVATDGSLLIASRDAQFSVMRCTPAGTSLGVFFSGEALSNEIYHIRRSNHGLYYLTDAQSKSQVLVLGPSGQFQGYVEPNTGYLAEARYLALPSGPYAPYCTVSAIEPLMVAGDDLNVTITIRDQYQQLWDDSVSISVLLTGLAISNDKLYTLGQDLSANVVHDGYGVYSLHLKPRLSSLIYPNETGAYLYDPTLISYMEANGLTEVDPEEFKYQLTIAITSFGFALGTQSYAVAAANTSATGTMLADSHAVGFAGFAGEIDIIARDQYGNRKLEGGEAEYFTTVVIDGRQDTHFSSSIVDKGNGLYALSFIATATGTQLAEIRFKGAQIVYSPLAMAISAGELNTTTSFLYQQGVNYFDIGSKEANLVFFQPRDTYGNLIPFRRSIASSNFTLEIEVPNSKFVAYVGNISYGLDGTFRTGYQIFMSPSKSGKSDYEQDKMLEKITLTATYNDVPLSSAYETSPFVVQNHHQYRDDANDREMIVAGLAIVAVGMVLSVAYAAGVFLLQSHQVFKFGNVGLLWLMCFGSLIVCAAPIVYGGKKEPTDAGCVGAFWLFHLGTAISLSALLAKTRRLSELMQGSRALKPTPLADRTRAIIVGPVVGTLLYMMVWTLTIPPKTRRLVTRENTSINGVVTQYEEETCNPGSLGWNYPILVIELLMLAYAMLLAYETRKLNRALLDGKQLSYVLYNFLFWAIVGFILFFALQLQSTEASVAFLVLCITCFLCFVLSLSILLLPKFIKAIASRERRLTLSDFLRPRTNYPNEGQPREDSTVELQKPPNSQHEAEDADEETRKAGAPDHEQDFL